MSKNTQLGNLVNGIYVDSTGKVGIGTQTPSVALDVTGAGKFSTTVTAQTGLKLPANGNGTSPTLAYNNSLGFGVSGTGIFFGNLYNSDLTTSMQFRVTNAGGTDITAMTMLSSGNIGIGTTSPSYKLEIANSTSVSLRLNNTGDTTDSFIQYDNTSTSFSVGAGANGWFHYTSQTKRYDWWIANVIKLQLASNGNLLLGTTSDNGYKLNVSGNIYSSSNIYALGGLGSQSNITIDYGYVFAINSNTQASGNCWYMQVSSSFSNNFRFFYGGTSIGYGSAKFQIDTGGGYTGISDINKKKDITLSTLGLEEILQLKPSTFKFKDDVNEEEQIGFIAQEVKDIIPYAYYEDKEGDDKFIGLKQAAFIPVLVKAIQELKAEIDILKQK